MEQKAIEGKHSASIPLEDISDDEFSDLESVEEPIELQDLELESDPSVRTRVRSRSRSVNRASRVLERSRLVEGSHNANNR